MMEPTTSRGTEESIRDLHVIELDLSHDKECMLCGHKEISEKLYGPLYEINDVVVHYFCIMFSSLVDQNGKKKEGIRRNLYSKIKNEILRGSRETCIYCKKMGATVTCCEPKCRKIFHLPCGLKKDHFVKSICKLSMTQAVDINDLQSSNLVECAICKEDVKPIPSPSSLWAPCCKHNSWFHRDCVQELALSAGIFFKCPLCKNEETFIGKMLDLGIYIPCRYASWDTGLYVSEELLARQSMCNAVTCLCPHRETRNYDQRSGSWEIILCYTCGSNGTHRLCSSLERNENWFCSTCSDFAACGIIDLTMDDDDDDDDDDDNDDDDYNDNDDDDDVFFVDENNGGN